MQGRHISNQSQLLDTTHVNLEFQYGINRRHLHVKCLLGYLQFQTVHDDQSGHCSPEGINGRL